MIIYRTLWMPSDAKDMADMLDAISPFMHATYTEESIAAHGELSFDLGLWLQIWSSKSGFFVVAIDGDSIHGVAMCVKYRPLWYDRQRLDIDRIASVSVEVAVGLEEYIVGVADTLRVDEIYRVRYDGGNEIKERIYG